ncbi:MAG: glycosyltransferase [bacterium]|nr:glycosyltransferase [bacterium]
MKSKLLFVIPTLELGGAERVIALLLKHLPRERFDLHLALVERKGAFLADLPDHIELHDLQARRVRYALIPLLRLVRSLKPDVVLPNLGYLNLALLILKPLLPRDTRVVLQEHTTVSAEVAERSNKPIWRTAYRLLYPRADEIISCSNAISDDLVSHFGVRREKLRLIRNPIDTDRIEAALSNETSPYTGPGPHILGAGRLGYEKGYDRLVDAFAIVARNLPTAQLWIVGEGAERAALEVQIEGLGLSERVHLPGYTADPFAWMRHADVFAQSSRREGLPVAVLEAVACGARVVAFDSAGGTGEIVGPLEGCILVPDGDLQGFANAIESLAVPEKSTRPELPEEFRLETVVRDFTRVLE